MLTGNTFAAHRAICQTSLPGCVTVT